MSQSFTKNDCSTGYTGKSIIYSVPASSYCSLISQTDADQKAQEELNLFGQQFANKSAGCRVVCSTGNCIGDDKKCVGGFCETGVKVILSSHMESNATWTTLYQYQWSDGSKSPIYSENTP